MGKTVKNSQVIKYLGFIINQGLTETTMYNSLETKCNKLQTRDVQNKLQTDIKD